MAMTGAVEVPPPDTVLGLPPWVVAVAVSVGASFVSVLGFVLQKKAHAAPEGKHAKIGEYVLSPLWFMGFLFAVIGPLPGDCVAYILAPLSLTAPLSGVTVALNLVMAPRLLGEQIQPWPDLPATMMILIGTLLTTCVGAHKDTVYSVEGLLALCWRPAFLCLFGVGLACTMSGVVFTRMRSDAIRMAAATRPSNPNVFHLLIPALIASAFGACSNICLKASMEIARQHSLVLAAFMFCATWPFAICQLNYINMGLRLYMQALFFPAYNALLVVMNTLYGSIFYEEYTALLTNGGRHAVLFVLGVLLVICGIAMFTLRKPDAEDVREKKGSNLEEPLVGA